MKKMTFQEINDNQGKLLLQNNENKRAKWERKGSESEMGRQKNLRGLKNVFSKA